MLLTVVLYSLWCCTCSLLICTSCSTACPLQESNYFTPQGEFRVDAGGSPTLLNCLMYKLCYYRFGDIQVTTMYTPHSPISHTPSYLPPAIPLFLPSATPFIPPICHTPSSLPYATLATYRLTLPTQRGMIEREMSRLATKTFGSNILMRHTQQNTGWFGSTGKWTELEGRRGESSIK